MRAGMMSRWVCVVVYAAAIGSAWAAPKSSKPAPKPPAEAPAPNKEAEPAAEDPRKVEARARSEKGGKLFSAKRYEDALTEYRAAYQADEQPAFLVNIAQCYRLLNRPESAKYFYQEYLLAAPETPYRGEIEGHLTALDEQIAKGKGSTKALKGDRELAQSHYRKGDAAFVAKRYDEAAREFAAAYVVEPQTPLLLNIAQAHRLAGDTGNAVAYYRRYLSRTEGATDPRVQTRRKEVIEILSTLGALPSEQLAQPALYLTPTDQLPPAPVESKRWGRKVLVGSIVVGALAGGAFVGQGIYVNQRINPDGVVTP